MPAREEDYDGPLMAEPPPGHRDRGDWEYGMGKRACEDVLAAAWSSRGFPSTRLRIPIVNGERDQSRRLESYVWRILDGGPAAGPRRRAARGCARCTAAPSSSTLLRVLGDRSTFGQAYNVCQDETPTLAELLVLLAELAGRARPPGGGPGGGNGSRRPRSRRGLAVQHAVEVVPRSRACPARARLRASAAARRTSTRSWPACWPPAGRAAGELRATPRELEFARRNS